MKLLFSAAAVAALSLATSAFAGADWRADNYAQINLGSGVAGSARASVSGVGSSSSDLNAGVLVGGLVGHSLGNGLSVEAEVLYDYNQIKNIGARVESVGGLANLKYEVPTHFKVMEANVAPYVGGGVGYGSATYSSSGVSQTKDNVMYQAKVGLAIHTSDKVAWDIGYRYLQLPSASINGGGSSVKLDTYVHGVTVGMRWNF